MKLICTQENFKKAILNVERIVSKQNTLPILNNILFEAGKGGLKLSATNLEMGIIVRIGAKIEKEGKITIPAKLISNFINNLPSGENITLEVFDQNLKIKSGGARAVIKGLPAGEFPLIPQKANDFQLILTGWELKNIINKTLVAIAFNEARQELTGINLILKEKELFFAATDSFRLAESRMLINEKNSNKNLYQALIVKKNSIIIPASTAAEVQRIISNEGENEVKIAIEEGQIFFEVDGVKIVSRLINGKYPDYKHILPTEFKTRLVGVKNDIQNAVKLANIFSPGKTSEICLQTDTETKKLKIEAQNIEVGENSSELKLDITGPQQKAILSARYLLDGLSTVATSQVAILINSSTTPIAIKEIDEKTGEVKNDYIYILMPIKN